jgi:putative inorganic carbon (HCO3(-)) transporter
MAVFLSSKQVNSARGRSFTAIRGYLINLDNLVLLGIFMTLFFMPLHEKFKALGFWITLIFWLTKLVKERKDLKIWIPPLGWALLLFVGVAFLSAIFSDYHNRATRGALDALRNTLFFLILANNINSLEKVKYLLFALLGGIFIGDLAAIHKYFSLGPEIEMLSLGDKNSTAQVLAMFLALTLGLLWTLRREYPFRACLLSVTVLTGFVLVLTYARGIWIAALAVLILFGLIRLDWKVPVAAILLVAVVWVGMSFSDRFTQKVLSLENPLVEHNVVERFEIWKQSLEIVKDRPILGIGLKTYSLPEVKHKYHLLSMASHAHNMFLQVAAETGVAGLLAVLTWLMFYLYAMMRMRPGMDSEFSQGLWLGGVGCFVILLVGGIAHPMLGSESSLMLMTALGVSFAGYRIENNGSQFILGQLYGIPMGGQVKRHSMTEIR